MSYNNHCQIIHEKISNLKRFSFPFNECDIPKNGIYILFEKGEKAHNGDRIVRIGTHTGKDQLISRLNQHFVMENKDRSIFRKNIGRAILNKNNDKYLEVWEIDFTTSVNREKYGHLIKKQHQFEIEKNISNYIQNNFSFSVIRIDNKEDRMIIESKLISEVSNCLFCNKSKNWLGNYSTKYKIRESGLWLVNELYKDGFNDEEFIKFEEIINQNNKK